MFPHFIWCILILIACFLKILHILQFSVICYNGSWFFLFRHSPFKSYALSETSDFFFPQTHHISVCPPRPRFIFFTILSFCCRVWSDESYREIHLKAVAVTSGNSYKFWHLDYSVRYHWLPDCYRTDCYWFQSATDIWFWHYFSLLKKKKKSNIHTYSFWSFSQCAPLEGVWLWNRFRLLGINGASWLTTKLCQIWVTGLSALTTKPFIFLAWPYSFLKGYFCL